MTVPKARNRYIEFFAFDYDSLPISFQSGMLFSFNSS